MRGDCSVMAGWCEIVVRDDAACNLNSGSRTRWVVFLRYCNLKESVLVKNNLVMGFLGVTKTFL